MQECVGFQDQHKWMSREPIDPHNHTGYIYLIHNTTDDLFYVGCKLYWFKRLKRTSRGKKQRVTHESDWGSYYGSSKDLTAAIAEKGEECFDRYIISEWKSKRSVANEEVILLNDLRVLTAQKPDGTYWYYNKAIGKAFRCESHTDETRAKMSAAKSGENHYMFGKSLSQETKDKISDSMSGENNPKCWKGSLPWDNPCSQKDNIKELWSLLDKIYLWWTINNHKKIGSGSISAAKHFEYEHSKTWHNMIKYCRKFPNETWWDSDEYLQWKDKFKGEVICLKSQETKCIRNL